MLNKSNNFLFTNNQNEEKNEIYYIKNKQLFENSSKKEKYNLNNNIISLEENENSRNIEKNNIQIKKYASKAINKKEKENKSNDIKSKSLFGDIDTKDLSKENNLFNNNKNSLLFQEKPFFSNESYKNLFSGSSLFGENNTNNNIDKNYLDPKKNKKKDGISSSSSAFKKKKKKKYSENVSGYLADSESESESIEKKIKNKVKKKKKLISKKENELDNKSDSSSSNYHPEAHNYFLDLLPFMSSDSEVESLNKSKSNNTDKLNDDEMRKEKEKKNLDKKEENLKDNEKENEINNEINNVEYNEKEHEKEPEINNKKSSENNIENEEEEEEEEKEEEEKEGKIKIIEFNEKYNNTKNIKSINYYTKKVKINKEDKLPSYDFIELKNSDDILYGSGTKKIYDCKNKKVKLKIQNYNFEYSEIIILKDNYFIYVDSFESCEIIIFHFEECNTKMIIDQKMDLPENIEDDPDGPGIAPHLFCYILNENFIIFK